MSGPKLGIQLQGSAEVGLRAIEIAEAIANQSSVVMGVLVPGKLPHQRLERGPRDLPLILGQRQQSFGEQALSFTDLPSDLFGGGDVTFLHQRQVA